MASVIEAGAAVARRSRIEGHRLGERATPAINRRRSRAEQRLPARPTGRAASWRSAHNVSVTNVLD